MTAQRRVYVVLLALALAAAVSLGGYVVWEFIMVDKCLDAGGVWDYAARKCDTGAEE